ncbi:MAG: hypothetical protein FWG74_04435 [Planctomycetes bacterium]|nr:hypothetical protein [Planctomycetota bacterium]
MNRLMQPLARKSGGLLLTAAIALAAATAAEAMDSAGTAQAKALQNLAAELTGGKADRTPEERISRGERINSAFVVLIGEAINPLFGVTAAGIYRYLRTDATERGNLPLYEQPAVWGPLLFIIILMAFNSTICGVAPFLNTPLNILGNITNAAGAAVLLPLLLSIFADSFAAPAGDALARIFHFASPAVHAAEASGVASIWLTLGWLACFIIGLFSYVVVWLTAYTVDVLSLLSPWSIIDAFLKSSRLVVMGLLALLNQVSPGVAIVLAAGLVVFSACFSYIAFKYFLRAWKFIYRRVFARQTADAGGGMAPR